MNKNIFLITFLLLVLLLVNVSVVEATVIQDAYTVNERNFIYDILPETSLETFKSNMQLGENDKIYNLDNTDASGFIATGMRLETSDGGSYILAVKGDISCDGKTTATDLIQIKEAIVDIKQVAEKEILAADMDENKSITGTDLMKYKRYQVGLDNLPIKEKGIAISETSITIDLKNDVHTFDLTAKVLPITANSEISWQSSDDNVASVDSNGKVTGKSNGTATITAKTSNGNEATCAVTVMTSPDISDFTISFANGYEDYVKDQQDIYMFYQNSSGKHWSDGRLIKVSSLQTIITTDTGEEAKNVTYTSSNPSVFAVSETGLLTSTATPSTEKTTAVRAHNAQLTISVRKYYENI